MAMSDRVVLISGALQGIGLATVEEFIKEGASVCIGDINDAKSEEVLNQLKAQGGNVTYVHLDVTQDADWEKAVKHCVATFGKITALVGNAGGTGRGNSVEETKKEDFENTMSLLATSIVLGCKHCGPELKKHPGIASVVNISSIMGSVACTDPSYLGYYAGKAACAITSQNIAIAWAKEGVRVNSVHPGYTLTPFLEVLSQEEKDAIAKLHPIGRLGQPKDIAHAVVFLASDKASFITGSKLYVDGGYTAL